MSGFLLPLLLIACLVELAGELFFGVYVSFFGAVAGVLIPKETSRLRRLRQAATMALCGAVVFGLLAYAAQALHLSEYATVGLAAAAVMLFASFLLLGNKCRRDYQRAMDPK